MSEVTAREILKALEYRNRGGDFFLAECKTGPSMWGGHLIFDALTIAKSWTQPCIKGYEIKVSRSDFLRDTKFRLYMPYCHEFYMVTPVGLIDRSELPADIGLIYYNPKIKSLTTKMKAVHRQIEVDSELLLYVIMNRLESDRLPFHNDRAEYFREWIDNKRSTSELGYHVKSKLVTELIKLEDENKSLKRDDGSKEELIQIRQVINKHNSRGCYIGRSIAEYIDKQLTKEYPEEVDDLIRELEGAIRIAKKMIPEKKADEVAK